VIMFRLFDVDIAPHSQDAGQPPGNETAARDADPTNPTRAQLPKWVICAAQLIGAEVH